MTRIDAHIVSGAVIVFAVIRGRPLTLRMASICSSGSDAKIALPTPEACSGTRLPSLTIVRIISRHCTWSTKTASVPSRMPRFDCLARTVPSADACTGGSARRNRGWRESSSRRRRPAGRRTRARGRRPGRRNPSSPASRAAGASSTPAADALVTSVSVSPPSARASTSRIDSPRVRLCTWPVLGRRDLDGVRPRRGGVVKRCGMAVGGEASIRPCRAFPPDGNHSMGPQRGPPGECGCASPGTDSPASAQVDRRQRTAAALGACRTACGAIVSPCREHPNAVGGEPGGGDRRAQPLRRLVERLVGQHERAPVHARAMTRAEVAVDRRPPRPDRRAAAP